MGIGVGVGKSEVCFAVMSNGMMEIEKQVNTDLKCARLLGLDAAEQDEACVSKKQTIETLDSVGVVCHATNNAEAECTGVNVNLAHETVDGLESECRAKNGVPEPVNDVGSQCCAMNSARETINTGEKELGEKQAKRLNISDVELPVKVEPKEASNDDMLCESVNGVESECCATNRVRETINAEESELGEKLAKAFNNCDVEVPVRVDLKEALNDDMLCESVNGVESECCARETINTVESELGEKQANTIINNNVDPSVRIDLKEASNDDMLCETVNGIESECCATNRAHETINIEEMELDEKQAKTFNNCDVEPSLRIEVKEASNDDIFSEVSNPNLSPRENTSSFQTISSQRVEMLSNHQGGFGEITSSFSSGNSSSEESVSEEEKNQIDVSGEVAKSSVVLEIPKEFSTTGIRKITFKFSKKEEFSNPSASAALSVTNGVDDGFNEARACSPFVSDDTNQPWISSTNGAFYPHGDPSLYPPNGAFYPHRDPSLYPPNMELKMSKKVASDAYPSNVKKLLSTGILEGALVKYISTSGMKQLHGVIKDSGYLCGCSHCNFCKVLSAYEFELHAGGKTRHPNNHIYLENGRPIYRIIQELKTAPLSQLEEVVKDVAGSSVNERYLKAWKANLLHNYEVASADQYSYGKASGMYQQFKPSLVMEDDLIPASYSYIDNFSSNPFGSRETAEAWKHVVKKPRCNFTVEPKRTAEGGTKKRDNDLHRSLFMPNGLPDGTDLAYYSKGKKILGGYKQGNGIVCSCCDTEISPSQFEAHAGCAAKRQPYRHIYTSNGLTLHDIALMLANGQSIATNNSDDMCTICGDSGELIFCEGCPRAFHAACLGLQCTETSGWLCSHCRDNFVPGRKTAEDAGPIMVRLTRVVKAPESEGGGCVVCRTPDFSVAKFDDRTIMLCDQCEKEYHVGCLRESGLCDLKELPKDKWFCCNDCRKVYSTLQKCILKGPEVIPAPAAVAVTKKLVQKCLVTTTENDIKWRILSGKSRYLEHVPFLTRAAAIFKECFDPIVAKTGKDLIPVMVYGRNISGQEFGGMYCIVLIVKSVVVSAGLVRIFGQEVAELPLVATCRASRGKGYFQALFGCIEMLLSSMHVKNLVLPAAEEAESIWTNKLGFRKMTDERYEKYSRDFQLTVFKGTSMLEKEVPAYEP